MLPLDMKSRLMREPADCKRGRGGYCKKNIQPYKEGYGYSYIAGILNSEGVKSPSNGRWNPTAIRRILLNRVYTGDTVQE